MLEKLSDALLTHFSLVALGFSSSHKESKTHFTLTPVSHFYTHFLWCHVFTHTLSLVSCFYTHSFSGVMFLHTLFLWCHVFTHTHTLSLSLVSRFYTSVTFLHTHIHSLWCHVFTPVSCFYQNVTFPSFSTLKMSDTLLINTVVHTIWFQFIKEKHNPRIVSLLCYTFQSFLGFKLIETLLIQHLTPTIKLQFIRHRKHDQSIISILCHFLLVFQAEWHTADVTLDTSQQISVHQT